VLQEGIGHAFLVFIVLVIGRERFDQIGMSEMERGHRFERMGKRKKKLIIGT
jgi:hypothetical protein